MVAPLANLIRYTHPQAVPGDDFRVSREADGSEALAIWNAAKLGAQPTPAQLTEADARFTTDETARAANGTGRIREAAVFADLARRMTNAGWTPDMAFARLLVDTITRVPAGSRTTRETQFLSAVQAANAAVP